MSISFPAYALAVSGCEIRLSAERWLHITEGHQEMAGYYFEVLEVVAQPIQVFAGYQGELLAYKAIAENRYIVVVYKEISAEEGFVITAFITSRISYLTKRIVVWPK